MISDFELAMEERLRGVVTTARTTLPEGDPRWAYVARALEELARTRHPGGERVERMRALIQVIEGRKPFVLAV